MEENSGSAPSPQNENDIVSDGDNLPSAASDAGHTPCAECGGRSAVASDGEKKRKNGGKGDKKRRGKKKKKVPVWLSWGLTILVLSFFLSVLFSFLTEIAVNDSPVYVCVIVLVVLLILNVGCDIIANAVLSCDVDGFNAMASRKIRGARRAVTFCKHAEKIASIFSDVIGDICGIISGSAGAVLAGYFVFNDSVEGMVISILISAVIGALTVGGKAFGKPISLKYNSKIAFGFAKFTTFFVREK
ncbi:MAG: hypothetical protein ACLSU0_07875 [Oscillospiraceae bacterium]